jgi:hypothetical protein
VVWVKLDVFFAINRRNKQGIDSRMNSAWLTMLSQKSRHNQLSTKTRNAGDKKRLEVCGLCRAVYDIELAKELKIRKSLGGLE